MTISDIIRLRLHNQSISHPKFKTPGEVVQWLVAVQAQDYLGSLWAIGLRLHNATESAVEQAIADRTIVRTWPQRGTLHFVAAPDVRWMLKLLTPRIVSGSAARCRQLELDDAVFTQSRKLLERMLRGKSRRRDAVYRLLESEKIPTGNGRGLHILWRLAQNGVICFGAREGKQQTIALLEEWVPPSKPLTRDESLAEIARRYFTSHGPATLADFIWWTGLTANEAQAALAMARSHLEQEVIDGSTYWLALTASVPKNISGHAYLLPSFDEYFAGYKDRHFLFVAPRGRKVNFWDNILGSPTVLINGKAVATWKRTFKKNKIVIEKDLFTSLSPAETRAVSAAEKRYSEFLEQPTART